MADICHFYLDMHKFFPCTIQVLKTDLKTFLIALGPLKRYLYKNEKTNKKFSKLTQNLIINLKDKMACDMMCMHCIRFQLSRVIRGTFQLGRG